MEDFDSILIQSHCMQSFLNIYLNGLRKYQLSGSLIRILHNTYRNLKNTMTRKTHGLFIPGASCLPERTTNFMTNRNVVHAFPSMFEQKMGRIRRKSGARKTVNCLIRCLNKKVCPVVLRWIDPQEKIFAVLFVNKKSPKWKKYHLSLFKEMDRLSIRKHQKYAKEPDSDQACKRRCKANLRKLCEDGVIEKIQTKDIDKCTKEVHYKFSDSISMNEEINTNPIENPWINDSILSAFNITNLFNKESKRVELKNGIMENVRPVQTYNTFAEANKHTEEESNDSFYQSLQNYDFKDDLNSSLNICNIIDPVPAMEESMDIANLLEMVDENEEEVINDLPLCSVQIINNKMDLGQVANIL